MGYMEPSMEDMMRRIRSTMVLGLIAVLSLGEATAASAQSFGDRLRQRAKDKITQRAEMRADQAMDKALDATEGAIVCAVTDSKCVEQAEKSGKQVVLTDENGNVVGHSAAEAAAPGSKAWANYDFVPGERVIFAEDFTADRVGDFPRR